ncbi:MAG: hypothetical protein KDC45_09640 [Bacteroidetes bacterium]|nr:hypothetical protein [Bacteroidota bacterium]
MKYLFLAACIIWSGCIAGSPEAPADAAGRLARKTIESMGGMEAFQNKQFLRFDFAVTRNDTEIARHRHLWDRFHGRYRVEGKLRDGKSYAVLFKDVNQKTGTAYRQGNQLQGKEAEQLIDYGYGRFINDTYWLLMPWKLLDPGVHLTYEGTDSLSGLEVLHLSFDSVGLTPGDQYWAYLNKTNGLIQKWTYKLEDGGLGTFEWKNWQSIDGVKFCLVKEDSARKRSILTKPVSLPTKVDELVFTDVTRPLP